VAGILVFHNARSARFASSPPVEPDEVLVQEGRDGIVRQHENANVDDPHQAEQAAQNSAEQLAKGDQGVVLVVEFVAPLELLHVLLENVHGLLELVDRFAVCLVALPFAPEALLVTLPARG